MVCDVASYPVRVIELLSTWCGRQAATRMIVTMKFQGSPDWESLNAAVDRGRQAGYYVRVKHFFNNKHECTLLLTRIGGVRAK